MLDNKNSNPYVIEMTDITKTFLNGKVVANDKVNLKVKKNEIHAIIGENGAGKSTLMSMLFGVYSPDSGEIKVNGAKVNFDSAKDATEAGLGMVHQHFKLIDEFTVWENVILGQEGVNTLSMINVKLIKEHLQELIDKYDFNLNLNKKVKELSVGQQQKIEILKLLYRKAEILIFDEPTAVLSQDEIQSFLRMILNFQQQGKTIIIITHKLSEIKSVANYGTVIRYGKYIDSFAIKDKTIEEIAELMVGRKLVQIKSEPKDLTNVLVKFDVQNLNVYEQWFSNIVKVGFWTKLKNWFKPLYAKLLMKIGNWLFKKANLPLEHFDFDATVNQVSQYDQKQYEYDKQHINRHYHLSLIWQQATKLGLPVGKVIATKQHKKLNDKFLKVMQYCLQNKIKFNKDIYYKDLLDETFAQQNTDFVNLVKKFEWQDSDLVYSPSFDYQLYKFNNYLANQKIKIDRDITLTKDNPFYYHDENNIYLNNKLHQIHKTLNILGFSNVKHSLKETKKEEKQLVNFSIKKGEIFAIAGVEGNGQTELALMLAGVLPTKHAKLILNDQDISQFNLNKRSSAGISSIPEDRHKYGLVLDLPIDRNAVLDQITKKPFNKWGFLNRNAISKHAIDIISKYDVRGTTRGTTISRVLSGGNQQKLVIGREMEKPHELLILVQPTRGMDLGAINFIHEQILKERDEGKAILLISYELDEIISLADTIAVMQNGKFLAVGDRATMTKAKIGQIMVGK